MIKKFFKKRIVIFILGVISGFLCTCLLAAGVSKNDMEVNEAQQPSEFTIASRFMVFQVVEGGALALCMDSESNSEFDFNLPSPTDPVVYIVAEGSNQFYDDQIIEVPKGKKAMNIGTLRYRTKESEKVVPMIKFVSDR